MITGDGIDHTGEVTTDDQQVNTGAIRGCWHMYI